MKILDQAEGKDWILYNADCVDVARTLKDESIHYSLFSPPFSSLFTYSNSDRDMGNVKDASEFAAQFGFLIPELFRITKPGRLLSFHCMQLPTSKARDGIIGLTDFRGDLIRAFCGSEAKALHEARTILVRLGRDTKSIDDALKDASLRNGGWIYHSEVCIWKDPVTAMQRTKALGLLHKQIKKDSCMSRQGIADYLVTLRKPGDNPERVAHTDETFPVEIWQRYASPVWMDIDQSNTLQYMSARENEDERHICPTQLDVIGRAIDLWTNPGDTVFSPFAGIGSEGWMALSRGRRFVGAELKRSYFREDARNLEAAGKQTELRIDVQPHVAAK